MIKLFDVNLPQITKWELKEKLVNLDITKKHSLYWFYSEFLLRANRNAWYKKVLNEGTMSVIDGKGLHWSMYKTMLNETLPHFYSQKIVKFPVFLRIPLFLLLFLLQLLYNILDGFLCLVVFKKNFSTKTQNETILGRDYVYEILKICNLKNYKVMIIGGSNEDDQVSKELINKLYPDIKIDLWTRKTNSLLMMDKTSQNKSNYSDNNFFINFLNNITTPKPYLTTNNIYEHFPDLLEAKQAVITSKPDFVLCCLGGGSGKQEFFIHDLMNDPDCKFVMATGLGAAIDHLGGEDKQKLPPTWSQKSGLEWLFRFFDQPYRRIRIIDSILTLYYWTTLHQFTKELFYKKYLTQNMVTKNGQDILVSRERSIVPNQIGLTFPESIIQNNHSIEETGILNLQNQYNLTLSQEDILNIPEKGRQVQHVISLINFLKNSCKYISNQYFVNFVDYKDKGLNELSNPYDYLSTEFITREEAKRDINPDKLQFSKF